MHHVPLQGATVVKQARAYYMQNIALSQPNHMRLSPPTSTMGTVTLWFIASPKDVQKTCSKWMLWKFWKRQVADLNQISRWVHSFLNMFETTISQEIPLKKKLFNLVLVQRTQDSTLNRLNCRYGDVTELWNCLDVDCPILAATSDVTM